MLLEVIDSACDTQSTLINQNAEAETTSHKIIACHIAVSFISFKVSLVKPAPIKNKLTAIPFLAIIGAMSEIGVRILKKLAIRLAIIKNKIKSGNFVVDCLLLKANPAIKTNGIIQSARASLLVVATFKASSP